MQAHMDSAVRTLAEDTRQVSTPVPRVVAIIGSHNEADVIGATVGDLIRQRIAVHLIDDGSTDGTVEAVEALASDGTITIERLPASGQHVYSQGGMVARKEAVAARLDADWFISHDADEIRESPWSHLSLVQAIGLVDALGYNAIDFELFNFWPTRDGFETGCDPRQFFTHYEPGGAWDRLQIRCWKNMGCPVQLTESGGHDAMFPGRRVFPIRFLLRHYPFRSQQQGERKLYAERRREYDHAELRRGWHVQYSHIPDGYRFVRDPAELRAFDPDLVRVDLQIHNRLTEEAAGRQADGALDSLRREVSVLNRALDERNRRVEALELSLDAANSDVERLGAALDRSNERRVALERSLDTANREVERRGAALDEGNRRVAALEALVAERDREQAGLHATLDERNRSLEGAHAALHQRNVQIAGMHAALHAAHLEIEALRRELDERNRHVLALDAQRVEAGEQRERE